MLRGLALCAVLAAASSEQPCFIAYADSHCRGTGVFQAWMPDYELPVPTPVAGACSAGQDYGGIAGHQYCEGRREENQKKCAELKCELEAFVNSSKCMLYSNVCKTHRNLTKVPGLHLVDTDLKPKDAQAYCSHVYARAGNGWRETVVGALAAVDPSHYNADTPEGRRLRAAVMKDCNRTFLVDAELKAADGKWYTSQGAPLDFSSLWAKGEPKAGATRVAIGVPPSMKNATAAARAWRALGDDEPHCTIVAYAVSADTPSSLLCDVRSWKAPLPTPSPVKPVPGQCAAMPAVEGQYLTPCADCSTYTTKADALAACCAQDGACLGILASALGEYSLGMGPNATFRSGDGQTYYRTPESFEHALVHPGLSPVLMASLVLFMLFVFYCAVGISFNVQHGETNCPEVLPHHELWSALPSLVVSLCVGVCSCSACSKYNTGYSLAVADDDDDDDFDDFGMDNDPLPSDIN